MKVQLTKNDAQEVLHKMGVLTDSPDLLDSYGLTDEQGAELYKSVPANGGEWNAPEWAVKAVCGEMENHIEVMRDMAADNQNDTGRFLACCRQANKFEKMFTTHPLRHPKITP